MLFNSYVFILFFLPMALIGFYLIGNIFGQRKAIYWLIALSLIFYSWWNYKFIILILTSVGVNYTFGGLIIRYNRIRSVAKRYLVAGLVLNLGLLAYFKYFNFFIDNVNFLFSTDIHIYKIILPVGISFYTFTQISYLVDLYREKILSNYRFSSYMLFVVYFPHLLSGPILNHKEMIPQYDHKNLISFNLKNFSIGLSLFALALFKKVIIADYLSGIASPLFAASAEGSILSFFESWVASISYTFQIYFDFSGYSEITIGLSLMFNVLIPANFFSPYKSKSLEQFWHRWHISLSRFLRDYLYIPLGGNRKGKGRQWFNLLVTMLLGGLWHGAAWTFVIWGGVHGILLMLNHAFKGFGKYKIAFLQWVITFFIVINTWVLFRAESLSSAISIYARMYKFRGIGLPAFWEEVPLIASLASKGFFNFGGLYANISITTFHFLLMLFLAAFIALCLPNIYQIYKGNDIAIITYRAVIQDLERTKSNNWHRSVVWAFIVGLLFAIAMLSLGDASEFLYFQF